MPVSREVLTTAVTSAPPPVVPARQAVLGAGAGRAVPHPPPAVLSRTVVATTKPPRAPVPFERQVEAIKANGGRPLPRTELARLQAATPVAPVRLISAGGADRGRAQIPATPSRASAAAVRPGASFTDREHALQNSRVPPAARADRAPPARVETPHEPPAPQGRTDRPPSAQQHLPPTDQQGFYHDDPTHAPGRPPSAPVNRPPAAAGSAEQYSRPPPQPPSQEQRYRPPDRKSTRLNSSHEWISYAVFCLKKKNKKKKKTMKRH